MAFLFRSGPQLVPGGEGRKDSQQTPPRGLPSLSPRAAQEAGEGAPRSRVFSLPLPGLAGKLGSLGGPVPKLAAAGALTGSGPSRPECEVGASVMRVPYPPASSWRTRNPGSPADPLAGDIHVVTTLTSTDLQWPLPKIQTVFLEIPLRGLSK